jgi:cytochrome oxidase Cu insertion factor (SCO1/SenC/PrrC family)
LPQADPHGDLITPADPIGPFELRTLRGRALDKAFLRDQWTLVYVGGSRCDLWCEASLFKMRQVRLTLGEDQDRVQRLYLLTDTQALEGLRPLLSRHRSMVVATPREESRLKVLTQFGPHGSGSFFLIDPNANLMMRYSANATSEGLKEDLTRLLEVSTIG